MNDRSPGYEPDGISWLPYPAMLGLLLSHICHINLSTPMNAAQGAGKGPSIPRQEIVYLRRHRERPMMVAGPCPRGR